MAGLVKLYKSQLIIIKLERFNLTTSQFVLGKNYSKAKRMDFNLSLSRQAFNNFQQLFEL